MKYYDNTITTQDERAFIIKSHFSKHRNLGKIILLIADQHNKQDIIDCLSVEVKDADEILSIGRNAKYHIIVVNGKCISSYVTNKKGTVNMNDLQIIKCLACILNQR